MHVGEICMRDVVFCPPATPVVEAAKLMREHHVGSLVIVDERNGRRVPIGLVTDRDIVVEVLAQDVAPGAVTVGDIETAELATASETADVFETLELMRRKGVRRLPVVDQHGALAGIVTLDDMLEILAEEIETMVKLISRERLRETERRLGRPETARP